MGVSDIILIIVLTLIICIVLKCEGRDMNKALPQKVFKDGKIESIFEYTVYWRRSLIISAVILLLSMLTGIINYSVRNIIIFLILSILVIYFQFNFYNYHQDKYILRSFDCNYNPEKEMLIASLEKPAYG